MHIVITILVTETPNGNCMALKNKVLVLMKMGYLNFNFSNKPSPNVTGNLLPNHVEPKINAIMKGQDQKVKSTMEEVKKPMKVIYEVLIKVGTFEPRMKKLKEEKKKTIFVNTMPIR